MEQVIFNTLYQLSLDPDRRALMRLPTVAVRQARALALAAKGAIIDENIMVYNCDAYIEMMLRHQFGYTWVPNFMQPNIQIIPGGAPQGSLIPYDPANPPARSIPVPPLLRPAEDRGQNDAQIIAMYPAWKDPNAPAPPTPPDPSVTSLVGRFNGRDESGQEVYTAQSGSAGQLTDGQVYPDPLGRGDFIFRDWSTPFGIEDEFIKAPPPASPTA